MSKRAVPRWLQRMWREGVITPHAQIRAEELPGAQASDRFFEMPDDLKFDAPKRLAAPAFFTSRAQLRQWERADWQHVNPLFMRWAALFQEYARKLDIPLYVHSAFRTEEEQEALVARGVSRTHYPRSAHNIGEAVDIVHGVWHWDLTKSEWAFLHLLGVKALERINAPLKKSEHLRLDWGGNWSFYDPAHWQITGYKDRVRILEGGQPVRRTPRWVLRHV